jgi:hypothetical protein
MLMDMLRGRLGKGIITHKTEKKQTHKSYSDEAIIHRNDPPYNYIDVLPGTLTESYQILLIFQFIEELRKVKRSAASGYFPPYFMSAALCVRKAKDIV